MHNAMAVVIRHTAGPSTMLVCRDVKRSDAGQDRALARWHRRVPDRSSPLYVRCT